jgi:hypothetical protein
MEDVPQYKQDIIYKKAWKDQIKKNHQRKFIGVKSISPGCDIQEWQNRPSRQGVAHGTNRPESGLATSLKWAGTGALQIKPQDKLTGRDETALPGDGAVNEKNSQLGSSTGGGHVLPLNQAVPQSHRGTGSLTVDRAQTVTPGASPGTPRELQPLTLEGQDHGQGVGRASGLCSIRIP